MKKNVLILFFVLAKVYLSAQVYVYSPKQIEFINDSIIHLGISYRVTPEDFGDKKLGGIKSLRVDALKFKTSKTLSFTPNITSLVLESTKIEFFDWKDLPRGITAMKLGSVPMKMVHFETAHLPRNLKEIHLKGDWSHQQVQTLLDQNDSLQTLVLEGLKLEKFIIENKTIIYLGLVDMDLSKIIIRDMETLSELFVDACNSFNMSYLNGMKMLSHITVQDSRVRNLNALKDASFLNSLTVRNSTFEGDAIEIVNDSLLKLRLTNVSPHQIKLLTPSLKQLDISGNEKLALSGLKECSDQLTHFYAYETTILGLDMMSYSFQELLFFGGLTDLRRDTLPAGYMEYTCSNCTGTLKRVPNDW